MSQITTADLVRLNEAAKALKQKDLCIVYGHLVGLDNFQNYIYYTDIYNINDILNGSIFNAKDLSDFVKSMLAESSFETESIINGFKITNTFGTILEFRFNARLSSGLFSKIDSLINLDREFTNAIDINSIADELRNMHVADGAIYKNIENHYVTLFPGIFPLVKADKLYVQFYDNNINIDNTFMAKYIIKKKHFIITCYICYLYI